MGNKITLTAIACCDKINAKSNLKRTKPFQINIVIFVLIIELNNIPKK